MMRNRNSATAAASGKGGKAGEDARSTLAGARSRTLTLNKKELRKFSNIAASNPDVEFLYLRDNEFDVFDPYISLDRLKVLDLSINNLSGSINFFPLTPALRHLYLTGNRINTMEGISSLPNLETLTLSENEISSFEGLQNLDSLRVLSLNYNNIVDFRAFPFLPSLFALNLHGNPIADEAHYRKMAVSVASTIENLDKVQVTDEERDQVAYFCGKIVFCIAEGMVVKGENVEEQAEEFLLEMQRNAWKSKPLQLQAINLRSARQGSNELVEGVPVSLAVCLQDIRPMSEAETQLFHSRFLARVRFCVMGDASEVLTVGSMNSWRDPIPMQRHVAGSSGEVSFQTLMYLPTGDYEYRYRVDGQEKYRAESETQSKYQQGPCNIYHVDEGEIPAGPDETQTILHIRWLRSNAANGFDLIEGENGLTYTPKKEDVGFCLRSEVLAYERGDFSFLYFDISTPIVAGAPTCEKLVINGTPAEGEVLEAEIEYSGGLEGQSVVQWFRVDPDGTNEIPLESGEIVEVYACSLADVGKRIRLDYTPVRSDHEAGAKVSFTSDVVSSGVPTCKMLDIRGPATEGEQLVAYVEYAGGIEGDSTFQWFRHNRAENTYEAIQGERNNTYTPGLEDVFHNLAVEYRPVSKDGVHGEPSRCVLENFILPGPPTISNLNLAGVFQEGMAVMVDFDYKGGRPAAPLINWFLRKDDKIKASASSSSSSATAAAQRSLHVDPMEAAHHHAQRTPFGRSNQKTQALSVAEVGFYIEVEVTPVREDGIRGAAVRAISSQRVNPSEPTIKSLKILIDGHEQQGEDQKVQPGQTVECSEEYHGGEQGKSLIEWQRGTTTFATVGNERKYDVTSADGGCMLKLIFTPVRQDGEAGEAKVRMIEVAAPPPAARITTPMEQQQQQPSPTQEQAGTPTQQQQQQPTPTQAGTPTQQETAPAASATTPPAASSSSSSAEEEKAPEGLNQSNAGTPQEGAAAATTSSPTAASGEGEATATTTATTVETAPAAATGETATAPETATSEPATASAQPAAESTTSEATPAATAPAEGTTTTTTTAPTTGEASAAEY